MASTSMTAYEFLIYRYDPDKDHRPRMQHYSVVLAQADRFVGPAGLLQAYRFIADSRDQAISQRLDDLDDVYRLFRCRTIMNCTDVCPKELSPAFAINQIRHLLVSRTV